MKYKFHRPNPEELKEYKKRVLAEIKMELKAEEEKKMPIDEKIKRAYMQAQFSEWEKKPVKPTKKSILEVNKELNNPIYNY